jgi:protein-disulfide isomerase
MPRNRKRFSRQRESSKIFQKNIFIAVGIVAGVIVTIAILANLNSPMDVSFPARELGSSTARVVVEEFSDYQCPYCGDFARVYEPILRQDYIDTGKVRFIFRNLPVVDGYVQNGNESHLAAMASLCAGAQGFFWEFHDLLFQSQSGENQGNFSYSRLLVFASMLHLESTKFDQCMKNSTYSNVINADIAQAKYRKLQGTPSFFVNGTFVPVTPTDFHELFDAIDQALR